MNEAEWLTCQEPHLLLKHLDWVGLRGVSHLLADEIRDVGGNPFVKVPFWESDGKLWCPSKSSVSGTRGWDDVTHWVTWRDGTVPKLAMAICEIKPCSRCMRGIYSPYVLDGCPDCNGTGREPWRADLNDFAILADALEEAGCDETAILDHLRGAEKCPCKMGIRTKEVCIRHEPLFWADDSKQSDFTVACSIYRGSGFRPVAHTRDCWVLNLFLRSPHEAGQDGVLREKCD